MSLITSGTTMVPLHAGEVVTAEVLSIGKNNDATVKLKNRVLNVQTDFALRKGDILTLHAEKQENALYLRIGEDAGEHADHGKNTVMSALQGFSKVGPATQSFVRLVGLLYMLPQSLKDNLPEINIIGRFLPHIENLSGQTLKDVVENGGIYFETKLRILSLGLEAAGATSDIEAGRIIANDLKASLLRIKDAFLAPAVLEHARGRVKPEELLGALNSALRNIEFYQLQSKLTDSLQFFLPLVWDQLLDGEIILRKYDRGKLGERAYACTIHLILKRAGKLSIVLLYQTDHVQVICAAENGNFSRMLKDGVELLEKQFRSAGLRLDYLAVHHEPKIDFQRNRAEERLSIRATRADRTQEGRGEAAAQQQTG